MKTMAAARAHERMAVRGRPPGLLRRRRRILLSLARHLCRLFALSLELQESYFDVLISHPGGIGRLLYYPPQPPADAADQEEGKLGLGAHTDYECFELLLSSANPGLEILFPASAATAHKPLWRPCPVREVTLTVNVADFSDAVDEWAVQIYCPSRDQQACC
jgi:isopenicillin N synthase-like dioxygenase